MKPEVRIFTQPGIMADALAEEFYRSVIDQFLTKQKIFVALSGGNTPLLFFSNLSAFDQSRKNKIDWKKIYFFWGDERCVPPESAESNYNNANNVLFSKIDIPIGNIHRIFGENDPVEEAKRYSKLILDQVPQKYGVPTFDWVFLGVGDDGHTASIFPNQAELFTSKNICEVATHPQSGQKRITLTGTVLNMAKRITFMAAGEDKQTIVKQIINNEAPSRKYPAAMIKPEYGKVDWYLDSEASDLL